VQTVLVLGGYGFFGHRISRALAASGNLRVLIAGRDPRRAVALAESLGLPPQQGVAVDAGDPALAQVLGRLGAQLVIHAAGPFQGQEYHVARAAIAAGCHYIDLADGRGFVVGIAVLDELARARGVAVISGASSVPALSSAVVERYLARFRRLDAIHVGISSGARAPGIATVRGVFSYGGRAFRAWSDGQWKDVYGWQGLTRHRFPQPLGARWLSDCDIPDLELFPRRYPGISAMSFKAGFASDLGHLVVWTVAGLVKAGVFSSLASFAVPLSRMSRWLEPLISDKGGMFVRLQGEADRGGPLTITWNLIARDNHGPHIPCGAAIALGHRFASGQAFPAGAMPCIGLLSVEEFLQPLRELNIAEVVE
jgi:saccharopine dehydrogenase-like NADP-dependent oxidoreductase